MKEDLRQKRLAASKNKSKALQKETNIEFVGITQPELEKLKSEEVRALPNKIQAQIFEKQGWGTKVEE